MPSQFLLNEKEYHFSEQDLPCLIVYKEKSGGSHFSVTMAADLFLDGSKLLFFTAYPMAKDNFLKQMKGSGLQTVYIESIDELETNQDAQAIILKSGDGDLFKEVVRKLKDIEERVILVKNMEVFDEAVINACIGLNTIILSGDLDKCAAEDKIAEKEYNSIIAFSKFKSLPLEIPKLDKYVGYMSSKRNTGQIRINMN